MKLGLTSISFRTEGLESIIEETKKAGLSCIEWGSDIHAPCNDRERLAEIVRLQKEADILCSSYGTYFRLGSNHLYELQSYIDAAKMLRTNILRLWCGDKSSQKYTSEEKKVLFETCRKAALIAEKNDVILCMECHNNTLTDEIGPALALMEAVNSPHFRMYWQPNQFKSEADNREYARQIAPYTQNIHVFNWKADKKYSLGSAIHTWKEYLSYFSGDQTLLLEFMPDNHIESLVHEAAALKEIAGGIL